MCRQPVIALDDIIVLRSIVLPDQLQCHSAGGGTVALMRRWAVHVADCTAVLFLNQVQPAPDPWTEAEEHYSVKHSNRLTDSFRCGSEADG